jgi:GT2 family glycosyltransferase
MPIGYATAPLQDGRLSAPAAIAAVEHQLREQIDAHLDSQGLAAPGKLGLDGLTPTGGRLPAPELPEPVSLTVVVATRGRPEKLRRCLAALQALRYELLEVVIVDNAPIDGSTADAFTEIVGQDTRFRYVCEPRPGLSGARNRGLQEARGEIVAFTEDDARVDSLWIEGLRRGFGRRADVACVTGLVPSASLDSPAEQYYDARVWFSANFEPRVFEARRGPRDSGAHPYTAGLFGPGQNMAFRTRVLRDRGGFDEALGTGSPTGGGEDLDAFVRILRSGHALAYEPSAIVWHEHRATEDDLERQLYTYGKGLAAYLTKYLLSPRTVLSVLVRVPRGLWHAGILGRRSTRARARSGVTGSVSRAELRGFLAGPAAYVHARRRQNPENRRMVRP